MCLVGHDAQALNTPLHPHLTDDRIAGPRKPHCTTGSEYTMRLFLRGPPDGAQTVASRGSREGAAGVPGKAATRFGTGAGTGRTDRGANEPPEPGPERCGCARGLDAGAIAFLASLSATGLGGLSSPVLTVPGRIGSVFPMVHVFVTPGVLEGQLDEFGQSNTAALSVGFGLLELMLLPTLGLSISRSKSARTTSSSAGAPPKFWFWLPACPALSHQRTGSFPMDLCAAPLELAACPAVSLLRLIENRNLSIFARRALIALVR